MTSICLGIAANCQFLVEGNLALSYLHFPLYSEGGARGTSKRVPLKAFYISRMQHEMHHGLHDCVVAQGVHHRLSYLNALNVRVPIYV